MGWPVTSSITKYRPSVGSGPRVEDARDAGVIHPRQHLALGLEACHDTLGVESLPDELERDVTRQRAVLRRAIDDPHAAFADDFDQRVRADPVAEAHGLERRLAHHAIDDPPEPALPEDGRRLRVVEQQRFHLGTEDQVVAAGTVEEIDTGLANELAGLQENLLERGSRVFGHGRREPLHYREAER